MAKQTITAFYDSREYANNAALKLKQAGVPDPDITVSPDTLDIEHSQTPDAPEKGFWASLEDLFGGSEDHRTYAEGLRRGGIMVVAKVDDAKLDDAINILEQHGSVDLNERESAWRSEGWTGGADIASEGVAGTGTGPLRSSTPAPSQPPVAAPATVTTSAAAPTSAVRAGSDDVLQVVEESLDVGKRAVNRGKVRIHSYVVETPVSETVNLKDETVTVDRRPVDRPLAAGELGADPFKDRTIEMDEVSEEAIVAKSTRVVEEIGIRKDVSDRTQTVSDTVRSTKVDVDDGRSNATKASFTGSYSNEIVDGMEVVGSDGQHVGVVDHLDGTSIKLKKMDPAAGGQHHLIPIDWVNSVDTKVVLTISSPDARSRWTAA